MPHVIHVFQREGMIFDEQSLIYELFYKVLRERPLLLKEVFAAIAYKLRT